MEEGVYLANFALSALSWGSSLSLMTYGWNPDLSDLSLVPWLFTSSNVTTHLFCFISSLFLPVCLMSHYSTILIHLSKWIDRLPKTNQTSALIPLSELQITPTLRHHFLCYFSSFIFYSLSSFLLVSLCSRTVLSLSAVLQRKSQHHAAKACVRSHLLNHLHRCLRGRPRKLTVGTLHQFDFLSLAGCQIVISSSLSRRDVLAATLLKGCIIGWTKRESQFSLDLKILRKNIF